MTLDKDVEEEKKKEKKFSRKRKRKYGDKNQSRAGQGGLINRH